MHPAAPAPQLPHRPFPAIQYTWVADKHAAWRAAHSLALSMIWNKPMWAVYLVCVALLTRRALLYGARDAAENVAVLAVVLVIVYLYYLARYRRSTTALAAPGAVWASGFGSDGFILVTPIHTEIVDYAAIGKVRKVASVVVCRYKAGLLYDILPNALVPDHELEILRAAAKKK
ncbi:hypothetical protein TSST111916_08805 [Tsukamurella strandjordii]|nr:hypothetical protein [Tsukamurella sp. TY48]GIZ99564.1 hypothetical protein TTY48_41760 [Tsukamurella sp. TY48]